MHNIEFYGRLDMEEKISELKDRKIEAAQTEHREKKRMGKKARLTIVYYVVF